MVYEDKPAPGRSLLLLSVTLGGSFLLTAFAVADKATSEPTEALTLGIFCLVVMAPVSWFVLNCIYRTSYKISDNTLELRCGFIYKKIRLGQIRGLMPASASEKPSGTGESP